MWARCTLHNKNQTFKTPDIPYFLTLSKIIFFCNIRYLLLLAPDGDLVFFPLIKNLKLSTKRQSVASQMDSVKKFDAVEFHVCVILPYSLLFIKLLVIIFHRTSRHKFVVL